MDAGLSEGMQNGERITNYPFVVLSGAVSACELSPNLIFIWGLRPNQKRLLFYLCSPCPLPQFSLPVISGLLACSKDGGRTAGLRRLLWAGERTAVGASPPLSPRSRSLFGG